VFYKLIMMARDLVERFPGSVTYKLQILVRRLWLPTRAESEVENPNYYERATIAGWRTERAGQKSGIPADSPGEALPHFPPANWSVPFAINFKPRRAAGFASINASWQRNSLRAAMPIRPSRTTWPSVDRL